MLVVERRSGSIFLADRVDMLGITQRINVGRADLRANTSPGEPKPPSALSTTASGAADKSRSGSGSGCDSSDRLGSWVMTIIRP